MPVCERVVVAAVDVEVDAVQVVDDLRERVEVERDQVVDLEPGQMLDRVERGGRAVVSAIRPRRVDPVVRLDRVSRCSRSGRSRSRGNESSESVWFVGSARRSISVSEFEPAYGVRAPPRRGGRSRRRARSPAVAGAPATWSICVASIVDLSGVRRDDVVERLVRVEVEPAGDAGADHDERRARTSRSRAGSARSPTGAAGPAGGSARPGRRVEARLNGRCR